MKRFYFASTGTRRQYAATGRRLSATIRWVGQGKILTTARAPSSGRIGVLPLPVVLKRVRRTESGTNTTRSPQHY